VKRLVIVRYQGTKTQAGPMNAAMSPVSIASVGRLPDVVHVCQASITVSDGTFGS
jgi:hypothetical protein